MDKVFLEGLFLQASLIFALGAQNLFVLEAGLRRENPFAVSLTCFFCDFTLIMLGVAGTATLLTQFHQLKVLFGILGIAFMLVYGLGKLMTKEESSAGSRDQSPCFSVKKSIVLSVTFSLFNPHAYLDAIVLIGGYSSRYHLLQDRVMIGLGAAIFSLLWFLLLSYGSAFMKPLMNSPRRMRTVMSVSGLLLILLAGKLSTEVYTWIEQMVNDPHCSVLGSCSPAVTLSR